MEIYFSNLFHECSHFGQNDFINPKQKHKANNAKSPNKIAPNHRNLMLSDDILPLWGLRGKTSWSLLTLDRSGNGESLQTILYYICDDAEYQHRHSFEMMGSLVVLCGYRPSLSSTNVRGRRLALSTKVLRSPPLHRRTVLKANLLTFIEGLEFRGGT